MDDSTKRAYKMVESVWNHMETPIETLAIRASVPGDGLTAYETLLVLDQLRELRRTLGQLLMTW